MIIALQMSLNKVGLAISLKTRLYWGEMLLKIFVIMSDARRRDFHWRDISPFYKQKGLSFFNVRELLCCILYLKNTVMWRNGQGVRLTTGWPKFFLPFIEIILNCVHVMFFGGFLQKSWIETKTCSSLLI